MQEVAHHGDVAECRDHCFKIDAKAADEVPFAVEPVELRVAGPGTVTLARTAPIGSTVTIGDLRRALDLIEKAAA